MGTRNLTVVVLNNEIKVAQYGQWDGYPSGQGETILSFLSKCNIDKFKDQVAKTKWITDDEIQKRYAEFGADNSGWVSLDIGSKFKNKYPQLDRDMAGEVLEYINDNDNVELQNSINFSGDSLFCEWCYVVDLDKGKFEVYEGFNKIPLTKKERFYQYTENKPEYYPVKLVKSYNISKLPTIESFLSHFTKAESE